LKNGKKPLGIIITLKERVNYSRGSGSSHHQQVKSIKSNNEVIDSSRDGRKSDEERNHF
jgi:hypothetical protein